MADEASDVETSSTSSSGVERGPLVLGALPLTSSEDSDSSVEQFATGALPQSSAAAAGEGDTETRLAVATALSDDGSSSAAGSKRSSLATSPIAKRSLQEPLQLGPSMRSQEDESLASRNERNDRSKESSPIHASVPEQAAATTECFWTEEDSEDESAVHDDERAGEKSFVVERPHLVESPSTPLSEGRAKQEQLHRHNMEEEKRRQQEEVDKRSRQAHEESERVKLQREDEARHRRQLREDEERKQHQLEHALERQLQKQRQLQQQEEEEKERQRLKMQEEEKVIQQKLQEEDARRREVEARRREEEGKAKRKEEGVRRKEEEEARRKEEEAKAIELREAAFWALLSPAEAERMRGMLQAVTLYQQQLQQNDQVLADLQEECKSKDKVYQSLKQRVQQASRNGEQAQEQEERAKAELSRWSKKREQYGGCGEDVAALRTRHQALQLECTRLREQHGPVQAEVASMREKLAASDEGSSSMAARLVALKGKCQQTVASLKAEHVEELAAMRAQQTEELSKLDIDAQNQLGDLWVHHAQDASRLRLSLDEAVRHRQKLRQDRDLATDQLLESQREGQRLQRQFADARQEVLELSAQLKASSLQQPRTIETPVSCSRSRSLTHLGKSSLASPAMDASIGASGELQTVRRRCKALEKEATRTHDALQKKQAQCERWRKLSLEHGRQSTSQSFVSGKSGPFTLGPVEISDLKLLSPHGTTSL